VASWSPKSHPNGNCRRANKKYAGASDKQMKDPGLFTDSTGEGMAGSIDVSLESQQKLKETLYNGSKGCTELWVKPQPCTGP
jgi:hypothetical protein